MSPELLIRIGVHQRSGWSPLLFKIVMNYLTSGLMDLRTRQYFSLLILFLLVHDIILLQEKFNKWMETFENDGSRISHLETKYLQCPLSDPTTPTLDIYIDVNRLSCL